MNRAFRRSCAAGVLFLVLGGCTLPEQFNLSWFQTATPGGDRVVAASLDSVSQSTQAGLRRLGFQAEAATQGDDVHIVAKTAAGDQLEFVLTRQKTDQGERTLVRLGKFNNSHDQTLFRLLADIEVSRRG
jgi:hypothetical protein